METCSACKNILKPEYAFCPFCGAPQPDRTGTDEVPSGLRPQDGEILLLSRPARGDRVIYRAWEVLEDGIRSENAGEPDKPGKTKEPEKPERPGEEEEPERPGKEKKPGTDGKEKEPGTGGKVPGLKPPSGLGTDRQGDERPGEEKKPGAGGKVPGLTPPSGLGTDRQGDERPGEEKKPVPGGSGLLERGPVTLPDTPQEKIAAAIPGDQVRIGGMAWRVLWIRAGSCLLLAETPAVTMRLTYSDQQVSWRTSTLRKWLNKAFVEEHFGKKLAPYLTPGKNSTRIKREDGYDFIESTEEKVTILSSQEYRFYVPRCRQTAWTTYRKKAAVRDLTTGMKGGGKIRTLQIENDREVWSEADTHEKLAVYPAVWWRTT